MPSPAPSPIRAGARITLDTLYPWWSCIRYIVHYREQKHGTNASLTLIIPPLFR